jgi:hypothetical protein
MFCVVGRGGIMLEKQMNEMAQNTMGGKGVTIPAQTHYMQYFESSFDINTFDNNRNA